MDHTRSYSIEQSIVEKREEVGVRVRCAATFLRLKDLQQQASHVIVLSGRSDEGIQVVHQTP